MKKYFSVIILFFAILGLCACGATDFDDFMPMPETDIEQAVDGSDTYPQELENEPHEPADEPNPEPQSLSDYLFVSKVSSLSIRSQPSTSSTVLGYLDKDDALPLMGYKENFYQTFYLGQTAYVSSSDKYTYILAFEKSSQTVEAVIDAAKTLLGYPYVWGSDRYLLGNGELNPAFTQGRYDCSALVQYAYKIGADISLNLTTRTQVLQGYAPLTLRRGDLMFFTNSTRYYYSGIERIGHVAIYLGNNYILHTASDHAVIEPISAARWNNYITARRFID